MTALVMELVEGEDLSQRIARGPIPIDEALPIAVATFCAAAARAGSIAPGKGVQMPPVKVDPAKVKTFETAIAFYKWLSVHHHKEDEVWIRIYKVSSGLKSITPKEAIDVCLCWGWIDAVRKRFDDKSYLQRYTHRRKRSIWSQINVDNVTRLIAEGRMTEHGLEEVEAAKADGRWNRAYGSGRNMTIPNDLQAAIDAEPRAKRMLATLSAQNRFALAFRVHQMKTVAGRKKKIATLVGMLKRGETIHPQRQRSSTGRPR